MTDVIVVGGGLAGCTAALELAKGGCNVALIEKDARLGGKTRGYGCKNDGACTDCGVCLLRGVFENAEKCRNIKVMTSTRPVDCMGSKGNFLLSVDCGGAIENLDKAAYILLATGFDEPDKSSIRIDGADTKRIHTGIEIESLLKKAGDSVFCDVPNNVAFIQCFGSRTTADKTPYCSRVCCGYSTRMARAIKHKYPDCAVDMFYMDLQEVESCNYPEKLKMLGIDMIRCRVSKVSASEPCRVWFETDAGQESRQYDEVILCGGIRPNRENAALANMFMLDVDENGFLQPDGFSTGHGVIPIGCASAPEGISRTIALARHAALTVLAEMETHK